MQCNNTAQVRAENKRILLGTLAQCESATKNDLAQSTGLSVATCNTLLNEMAATGEVYPCGQKSVHAIGRPSERYCFNPDFALVCCVFAQFDGTSTVLKYCVANLRGEIIEESTQENAALGYTQMKACIENLRKKYPAIAAIGAGMPGVVSAQGSLENCDVPAFAGCALKKQLTEDFDISVTVENDMNAMALGMAHSGDFGTAETFAALIFHKGVSPGAGVVVNGSIVRGTTSFAGEISHLCPDETLLDAAVRCMTVVLNPAVIAVTGNAMTQSIVQKAAERLSQVISARHCPKICFTRQFDSYYRSGMIALCLQQINAPGAKEKISGT